MDGSPDFLERLKDLGGAWSQQTPTALYVADFAPGSVKLHALTRAMFREEAEALQLSIIAQSRALEEIAGGQSAVVLKPGDDRTFGSRQILAVEFDKDQRPIRATDAWGYFRNNIGEKMSHEYVGSRSLKGGVFVDQSPRLYRHVREHVIIDQTMLPVTAAPIIAAASTSEKFQGLIASLDYLCHERAMEKERTLAHIQKTLAVSMRQELDRARNFPVMPW
jgi:hypothetical protein